MGWKWKRFQWCYFACKQCELTGVHVVNMSSILRWSFSQNVCGHLFSCRSCWQAWQAWCLRGVLSWLSVWVQKCTGQFGCRHGVLVFQSFGATSENWSALSATRRWQRRVAMYHPSWPSPRHIWTLACRAVILLILGGMISLSRRPNILFTT